MQSGERNARSETQAVQDSKKVLVRGAAKQLLREELLLQEECVYIYMKN